VSKSFIAAALALLLVACGVPQPRQAPHAPPAPPVPPAPHAPAGQRYRIDTGQSEIRVLVYRAGVMAALGHNHVIVNRSLSGWVTVAGSPSAAAFALTVPAANFVVDDGQARSEEGADFAEPVADDAKAGTAHNMLGPSVLDAEQHPSITLRSVSITETGHGLEATVAIDAAGHESQIAVPFAVERAEQRLIARGALTVRQTALGLTPFSIFLGALRVDDALGLKFRLVATAE
jgi:polyisoprenoid-binding protein YceI